jgi:hypothetical protein
MTGQINSRQAIHRFPRHRSLQYLTAAHTAVHFFRQLNGRPQAGQIF